MRVLLTGGAGYVGGFCARHMAAQGHHVTVLDNLSEGHAEAAPAGSLSVGDIANTQLVTSLLREREIEAVIHFAASCYVGESMSDPRKYYRNNLAKTLALLEALVDSDVKRIVFSSSCSIYGETAEMPLSENLPAAPASTYAFTKHAVETMIRDFSRAYGLRFALLRYFNASGAAADGSHGEDHDPESHLIPIVLQTLQGRRERMEVFGDDYDTPDGTCIRDYVHVSDLARAHELAASRLIAGGEASDLICNLGTGSGTSVLELIRAAERVSGLEVPYRVSSRRPGDTARLVADNSRAREELGWKPEYATIEPIVETAWAWHQAQPSGYPSSAS